MSEFDAAAIERETRAWVELAVVGLNLCPFAEKELQQERVEFQVLDKTAMRSVLEAFARQAQRLCDIETSMTVLMVLPRGFDDFDDYLDLLELCEALIEDCGWEESLQLASFHPRYCFDGLEPEDAANYTNRSPYPILHLLRCADVAQAIEHYPAVGDIPIRNEQLARERGEVFFRSLLLRCASSAKNETP